MPNRYFYIALALCAILLTPESAFAQTGNIATDALKEFETSVAGWGDKLEKAALYLLRCTLIVEIGLLGLKVTLRRADPHEILAEFTTIFVFGVFIWAVIANWTSFTGMIIRGIQRIAGDLGHQEVNAGDPFGTAMTLVKTMLERLKDLPWHAVGETLFLFFSAIVIGVSFMLISAVVVIIKCEFVIVANAGLLLLGFGGSKIFKEYAINVMRYVLSVAMKLFVMQIVVGVGMDIFSRIDLSGDAGSDAASLVIAAASSILLLVLAWTLPNIVGGIMSGSQIGSGNPLAAATAATAGRAINAIKQTAGGGSKVGGSIGGAIRNVNNARVASRGMSGGSRVGNTMRTLMEARSDAKTSGLAKTLEGNPGSVSSQLQSRANAQRAIEAAAKSGGDSAGGGQAPVDMTKPPHSK